MVEGGLKLPSRAPTFAPGDVLQWPPEQFRYDMREAETRERMNRMDVAGRARYLVWGPYMVLPAGRWRATVRLAFDRWSCRHNYCFEFGAAQKTVKHEFTPGREGVFEFIAEQSWEKLTKAEVRVRMIESSLGGVFEFQGAEIELCPGPSRPS